MPSAAVPLRGGLEGLALAEVASRGASLFEQAMDEQRPLG
jgi:hypothetical protein